jgi:hypothetical protein
MNTRLGIRTRAAAVAAALVVAGGAWQELSGQSRPWDDANLTYAKGQSVVPVYHGFEENPDGTFTMHFGYLNRNWQEEVDIPVGTDNNVTPAPLQADQGQPTHFLPRNNRWQFSVTVPKAWGDKDVVWTLTSHGRSYKAYGSLKNEFLLDEAAIWREYAGGSPRNNQAPRLEIDGETTRTVKVGQPVPLVAFATDDGIPSRRPRPMANAATGGGLLRVAQGLRFVWVQFRGPGQVKFDPPQPFKAWEDEREGSPWAYGWAPPPLPPDNRWAHNVTFPQPGTYVLRGVAHDGGKWTQRDVTFTVVP